MKIKKKTSLMMVAASSVAIMGVAAVSFAAWTGNTNGELTAEASTGHVELVGFSTNTVDKIEDLVPLDQGSGNTLASFEVKYSVTDDSKITGKYEITTTDNAVTELELWVCLSDSALTNVSKGDLTAENSAWVKLDQTGVEIDGNITASSTEVTKHVNLVLVSDDLVDMDQDFTLTLEIATK